MPISATTADGASDRHRPPQRDASVGRRRAAAAASDAPSPWRCRPHSQTTDADPEHHPPQMADARGLDAGGMEDRLQSASAVPRLHGHLRRLPRFGQGRHLVVVARRRGGRLAPGPPSIARRRRAARFAAWGCGRRTTACRRAGPGRSSRRSDRALRRRSTCRRISGGPDRAAAVHAVAGAQLYAP